MPHVAAPPTYPGSGDLVADRHGLLLLVQKGPHLLDQSRGILHAGVTLKGYRDKGVGCVP
jgi:hypothetical protein